VYCEADMPIAGPPLDATLKARLAGITAEMKSDKFWRDMAIPIDAAMRALRDEEESFDSVSANECRKTALAQFEASEAQLKTASDNGMFVTEYAVVKAVLAQLKAEDGADTQAEVQKACEEQEAKAKERAEIQTSEEERLKALQAKQSVGAAGAPSSTIRISPAAAPATEASAAQEFKPPSPPYTWVDEDDEVSVSIPVPPGCQKQHVRVVFAPRHLTVSVQGHPMAPVIDSDLLYGIKSSECTWSVGGSGAKRQVTLTLEKALEEKWTALLDDEEGRRIKSISSIMEGAGLEQWTSDHSS